MFVTLKITAKRLFVVMAAVVSLALAADAARSTGERSYAVCRNDTERIMYLEQQGLQADREPLWSKQTVIDPSGGDGWEEYAQRLKGLGFDLKEHFGRPVTVYCYSVKYSEDYDCVRVVCSGDKVIGYEPQRSVRRAEYAKSL